MSIFAPNLDTVPSLLQVKSRWRRAKSEKVMSIVAVRISSKAKYYTVTCVSPWD